MNIQKTNNGTAFGMAFRLKDYKAAEGLAKKFHNYSDPSVAEKYFVKDVVKPLKNLKSDVLYDGKDVFVINGFTKDKYKLLGTNATKLEKSNGISYPVEHNGKTTTFSMFSSKPDEEVVNDKFKLGVKIAQYIESISKSAVETVEETAGRLMSIYK